LLQVMRLIHALICIKSPQAREAIFASVAIKISRTISEMGLGALFADLVLPYRRRSFPASLVSALAAVVGIYNPVPMAFRPLTNICNPFLGR
jgi:hypothetical protein